MDAILRLVPVVAILLMTACSRAERITANAGNSRDPLMAEIASIVGPEAKACGRVPLGTPPENAWRCAELADSQGIPHWFAMQRQGIDSKMWSASLLAPSGERFILIYDSNYMGGPGLLPSFTRMTCDGHVVLAPASPDGSGLRCVRKHSES